MFKKIAESLATSAGTSNTQIAFVLKPGLIVSKPHQCGVENVIAMRKQACFAGIDYGITPYDFGAGITNKEITHMVYDIQNAMKTYKHFRDLSDAELKAAYKIARVVFNLPYLRPLFQNKSFKDAYENGLIIKVVEGTPNAQFFLGPYLIRHIYVRVSCRTFLALKKNKKYALTEKELAMLSFFFSGERPLALLESDLKVGGLPGYAFGHSVVDTQYCSMEYLFKIISAQTPKFHNQGLWKGSPYINKAVCGVDHRDNVKGTRLPTMKVGEGFQSKYLYSVDKIVEEFLKYKKGLKNAE